MDTVFFCGMLDAALLVFSLLRLLIQYIEPDVIFYPKKHQADYILYLSLSILC